MNKCLCVSVNSILFFFYLYTNQVGAKKQEQKPTLCDVTQGYRSQKAKPRGGSDL